MCLSVMKIITTIDLKNVFFDMKKNSIYVKIIQTNYNYPYY